MSNTTTRPPSMELPPSGLFYPLILEHIFTYQATYEMPLRTMFTINATRPMQIPSSDTSRPPSRSQSRAQNFSTPGESPKQAATAQFTSCLMDQMTRLPSQPTSLPPIFITTFLRRCFPPELDLVDFPQSLTALDYLKDMEMRRRRELKSALGRLGIDGGNLNISAERVSNLYPTVSDWISTVDSNERKVEALYTQIFVALRRWILINELSLTPFNKHNCIAMLNTLYPPTMAQPTALLTPEVLKRQRDGFFSYIGSVEKRGPRVLKTLIDQGKQNPDDRTGWPSVRRTLDQYLRVANSLIDEYVGIADIEYYEQNKDLGLGLQKKDKKTDSGISFTTSTTTSHTVSTMSGRSSESVDKQRVSEGSTKLGPFSEEHRNEKGLSTLEKIARRLRIVKGKPGSEKARSSELYGDKDLKSSSHQHQRTSSLQNDMNSAQDATGDHPERSRSFRKLRGAANLRARSSSHSGERNSQSSDVPAFDRDEMQRQRLLWEAKSRKESAEAPA